MIGYGFVAVMKPTSAMQMVSNTELAKLARTVEENLRSVFDSIEAGRLKDAPLSAETSGGPRPTGIVP
jgi:hypothetical protein